METIADYFAALWNRRDSALLLEPRTIRYANGDQPLSAECHGNVDRWVDENGSDKAVRGWLVMNYGFERHSVVETCAEALIDITLPTAYAFLRHDGDQALFDHLGRVGCNQVFWPPSALRTSWAELVSTLGSS